MSFKGTGMQGYKVLLTGDAVEPSQHEYEACEESKGGNEED